MDHTPEPFMDKLLRPKSRWAYALWMVLALNFINDSHKSPDWTSIEFRLVRIMAAYFGLLWCVTTLSRLREFGWSPCWVIVFTLPWFGLIWIFWWNPAPIGIAALALWFVSQSIPILKNGRSAPDPKEAEEKA